MKATADSPGKIAIDGKCWNWLTVPPAAMQREGENSSIWKRKGHPRAIPVNISVSPAIAAYDITITSDAVSCTPLRKMRATLEYRATRESFSAAVKRAPEVL